MKETIGSFKCGDKEHNIYAQRGYGNKRKYVYIGNATFGVFFKFQPGTELIWINPGKKDMLGRIHDNQQHFVPLYFPMSEGDLQQICYMTLKTHKLTDIIVKSKCRKDFLNTFVLDAI